MAYDGTLKFDTKIDSSGFKNGISKIASIAKTGMKAAVTSIGAVSTALTAAGGYAIKVGSDFEAGMSEVSAISGATGEDLAALTDKAKEMGAKTKFSATDSAEAFKYMAMAGWKTSDMLGGIEGVMNLAAASGEDLATVSDICTDALTAFGLQASDSAHFADVLAKAASSSNTNVGMMGATFKYVAPIAGSMKYSIEDTAVAIGLMANAGIKGEQAGTSLRAMLTRLVDPPKDAAAALDALNISATNADGSMRPLHDVLVDLRKGFANLDDSQKASYASSIAGTEAMSGLLAIVNASDDDFNKLTEAINNSDGAAKQTADTMQDNLKGAMEELSGSAETLGLEVYEQIQTPLKNAAQQGTEYINQITDAFRSGGLQEAVAEAGNIFAELATKAAQQAPEMINAAVGFIQSFMKGISDNAPQLIKAAQDIVWALVDGLVKLLPKEVQKPVKETVDILKKSFQDGGLRQAINTVGDILKDLGNVATSLAKTFLPPLAKAVDFLGKNLKILIPLATAAVAAWKTWKIVRQVTDWMGKLQKAIEVANTATKVKITLTAASAEAERKAAAATGASTAALSLKQVAVGVLTGKIGLATAAQWAWNTAMSENPIGAVIGAVSFLTTVIGGLCSAFNNGTDASQEQAKADQALTESFDNVAEAADNFQSGLDTAKSHLSEFDDTLFASSEEQQNLQDNMQKVQDGITSICRRATEERRDYTDAEIQQLDEYFNKLNELNQQQLDIEKAKADAIKDQAEYIAETHSGSLVEYQQKSQEWIKTAQDQADQQTQIINDQTNSELVLLKQAFEDRHKMSQDEYDRRRKKIIDDGQQEIADAQSVVGEVSNVYLDGYLERADDLREWLTTKQELAQQEQEEIQKNNEKIQEIENTKKQELEKIYNDTNLSIAQKQGSAQKTAEYYDGLIKDENQRHADEMGRIQQGMTQDMTKAQEDQLGVWIDMLGDTELYGGDISTENQEMVDTILSYYGRLEGDAKQSFKSMMDGAMKGIEEKEPSLFAKASSMIGGVINKINTALGVASPSKVMRRIFRYVVEGAELGMEDEAPSLYKQTDGVTSGVVSRFQKAKLDASSLVSKMRAAIASEHARISAPMTASAQYTAVKSAPGAAGTESAKQGGNYVAEVHVDLDGREVARVTAPFIGEQLAWEG